jgi:hypothetical protein
VNKGSLSGHGRSIDKWQGSKEFVATPSTSYGLRNRANFETNSLKSIADRLRCARRGSSSSPEPTSMRGMGIVMSKRGEGDGGRPGRKSGRKRFFYKGVQ